MKDFKKMPKMAVGGSVESLESAYKKQANSYPNKGYNLTPNWEEENPEWAAETAKTAKEYETKAKENRMDELKKTVNPFKRGGKVKK